MKNFIHKDYLLTTDFARELYHRFAENEPIIDYHCHLPPREIAEDRRWKDISEVWLGGDHYKWRQMRSNGVDEEFCTGSASGHGSSTGRTSSLSATSASLSGSAPRRRSGSGGSATRWWRKRTSPRAR